MKNSAHEAFVEIEFGRYGGCHYPAVDIAEHICGGQTCLWFVGHAAQPAIDEVLSRYSGLFEAARLGDASARAFLTQSDPATLLDECTGGPAWRLARNRIAQELGICRIASGSASRVLAETILCEAAKDGIERRLADCSGC